jgi:uncharacterized protein (TIGR02246 family)
MSSAISKVQRALALALFAGLLAASAVRAAKPAKPSKPPASDAAARREVEAAMQQYTTLLRTGPPDAVAALFTADGELLEPGMDALKGPAAIRAFLEPLVAAYEVQAASSETEAVEVFGKTAYQWGTYKQTVATKSKAAVAPHPVDYRGRYVASWRREPDGHWRLARMLVQPFPPVASNGSAP